MTEAANIRPNCDYLLCVGPGRSGTTYIYEILRDHYAVDFPEIKEAYYYQSCRRYRRARQRLPPEKILGDVANQAHRDPDLPEAIQKLRATGARILLLVVLRNHQHRAESMVQYAVSRGRNWRRGRRGDLVEDVVSRRLTSSQLEAIFAVDTDVLTFDFNFLVEQPGGSFNLLAKQCNIPPYLLPLPTDRSNPSEVARSKTAAAMASLLARGLRRVGLRQALQFLKESRWLHRGFFKPAPPGSSPHGADLAPQQIRLLEQANQDCWAVVRQHSVLLDEGVYLARSKISQRVNQTRT